MGPEEEEEPPTLSVNEVYIFFNSTTTNLTTMKLSQRRGHNPLLFTYSAPSILCDRWN